MRLHPFEAALLVAAALGVFLGVFAVLIARGLS
jgi:hypothetical protein